MKASDVVRVSLHGRGGPRISDWRVGESRQIVISPLYNATRERTSRYFDYFRNLIAIGNLLRHLISMKLEEASGQLEALGNPMRLQIYRLLVRAGADGLPVGAIQDKVGCPASTLSHHMRKLVETGLVSQERHATTLICRALYPAMTALIGYLSNECCADGRCPPSRTTRAGTRESAR